jgi:hypothetical protein
VSTFLLRANKKSSSFQLKERKKYVYLKHSQLIYVFTAKAIERFLQEFPQKKLPEKL